MATHFTLVSLSLIIALAFPHNGYSQGESGPNPAIELIISASPNDNSPYVHKGCSIKLSATMTHAVGEGTFTASISSGSGTVSPETLSTSTTSAQTITLTGDEVGKITVEIDYSPPGDSGLNDPEPVTVEITCFTFGITELSGEGTCDGHNVLYQLTTNPESASNALNTLDSIKTNTEAEKNFAGNPSGEETLTVDNEPSASNSFKGELERRLWYSESINTAIKY